ncbi:MAG: Tex family protein [Arenicella sp.]
MVSIEQRIADELSAQTKQVVAAIALLDEGATVPFISRYRKEVTGGLDDAQLRQLEDRLRYLRELEQRRSTIIESIADQEKLTDDLRRSINEAQTKTALEDLYLPYKPKRRTKGQIAIEAGLQPLAEALYEDPQLDPTEQAKAYINEDNGVADSKQALDGARYILMERFSEDAELLANIRQYLQTHGQVTAVVVEEKKQEGAKFRDYFDYSEAYKSVPSHRALALFRGRNEGVLQLNLIVPTVDDDPIHPCEKIVAAHWSISNQQRPADSWLQQVVSWTWKIKVLMHLELDLMGKLREQAETEAIRVFAANLTDLLLAAPAGPKATMGLDPGLRTGVKVAVVDQTGQYLDHATIYPHAPKKQWDASIAQLAKLIAQHQVELVAIGNGTASRETDKLVADLIQQHPDLSLTKIMVNEAGASIYSASEFASKEFPDLDVTIRGAVSIARRLQDPLAELVKIEPKSIGVGQYQHDVNQYQLARSLDAVVEDCVNNVGVDINTASMPLLRRVSGLNETLANNIVEFRNQHGAFKDRKHIRDVPRMGEKTFEQAAGFLRIMQGDNPLDRSSVHPEAYQVVETIAAKHQREVVSLLGDSQFLRTLDAKGFTTEQFGLPTVTDIIRELDKPGRDPRPEFKMASLRDGIEKLTDLKPNMILEGTVTNVTNFGAFVDIGVHQDGLVHISALADKFVQDPHSVVKAGQIVKVKVVEIDPERKRIALSMRLQDAPKAAAKKAHRPDRSGNKHQAKKKTATSPAKNALAAKLSAALAGK